MNKVTELALTFYETELAIREAFKHNKYMFTSNVMVHHRPRVMGWIQGELETVKVTMFRLDLDNKWCLERPEHDIADIDAMLDFLNQPEPKESEETK